MEQNPQNNKEVKHRELEKAARIISDALLYIRLMRKKDPKSLKLELDGKFIFKMTQEVDEILGESRKKLSLTPEEMAEHIDSVAKEVERILADKV